MLLDLTNSYIFLGAHLVSKSIQVFTLWPSVCFDANFTSSHELEPIADKNSAAYFYDFLCKTIVSLRKYQFHSSSYDFLDFMQILIHEIKCICED